MAKVKKSLIKKLKALHESAIKSAHASKKKHHSKKRKLHSKKRKTSKRKLSHKK